MLSIILKERLATARHELDKAARRVEELETAYWAAVDEATATADKLTNMDTVGAVVCDECGVRSITEE